MAKTKKEDPKAEIQQSIKGLEDYFKSFEKDAKEAGITAGAIKAVRRDVDHQISLKNRELTDMAAQEAEAEAYKKDPATRMAVRTRKLQPFDSIITREDMDNHDLRTMSEKDFEAYFKELSDRWDKKDDPNSQDEEE